MSKRERRREEEGFKEYGWNTRYGDLGASLSLVIEIPEEWNGQDWFEWHKNDEERWANVFRALSRTELVVVYNGPVYDYKDYAVHPTRSQDWLETRMREQYAQRPDAERETEADTGPVETLPGYTSDLQFPDWDVKDDTGAVEIVPVASMDELDTAIDEATRKSELKVAEAQVVARAIELHHHSNWLVVNYLYTEMLDNLYKLYEKHGPSEELRSERTVRNVASAVIEKPLQEHRIKQLEDRAYALLKHVNHQGKEASVMSKLHNWKKQHAFTSEWPNAAGVARFVYEVTRDLNINTEVFGNYTHTGAEVRIRDRARELAEHSDDFVVNTLCEEMLDDAHEVYDIHSTNMETIELGRNRTITQHKKRTTGKVRECVRDFVCHDLMTIRAENLGQRAYEFLHLVKHEQKHDIIMRTLDVWKWKRGKFSTHFPSPTMDVEFVHEVLEALQLQDIFNGREQISEDKAQ